MYETTADSPAISRFCGYWTDSIGTRLPMSCPRLAIGWGTQTCWPSALTGRTLASTRRILQVQLPVKRVVAVLQLRRIPPRLIRTGTEPNLYVLAYFNVLGLDLVRSRQAALNVVWGCGKRVLEPVVKLHAAPVGCEAKPWKITLCAIGRARG
jgi:hypothetical protein